MGEQQLRWSVKCRAHRRKNRLPCRQYAIRGGFVCHWHGGAAPQVKAAAQKRWQAYLVEQGLAREASSDINAVLIGLGKVARNRLAQLRLEGY